MMTLLSLEQQIEHAKSALDKIKAINSLCTEIRRKKPDESIRWCSEALALAEPELEDEKILLEFTRTLTNTAISHYTKGLISDSIEYTNRALEIYQAQGWEKESIEALSYFTVSTLMLGDNTRAYELSRKQIQLAEKHELPYFKGVALQRIGVVFSWMEEYQKAIEINIEALEIWDELGDLDRQAQVLTNTTIEYTQLGDYEGAIDYGTKSLSIFKEIGNIFGESEAHLNLSMAQAKLGDMEMAFEHALTAVNLVKETKREQSYANTLLHLGKLHNMNQQPEEALEPLTEVLEISERLGILYTLFNSHQELSNAYKALGNVEKALEHFEQFYSHQKQFFDEKNTTRYQNLEVLHRTQQAQQEAENQRALREQLEFLNKELESKVFNRTLDLLKAYETTLAGWAKALEFKDQETEGHARRVTNLAVQFAQRLGWDETQTRYVRYGALLHDIGKIGVSDNILKKKGPLTAKEWTEIQKHTLYAKELIEPIDFLIPALPIPVYHHEQWDGKGYPYQYKGNEIPIEARLFSLVDNWDALTSVRPYSDAWTESDTLAYIREQSGKKFDPQLVEIFIDLLASLKAE